VETAAGAVFGRRIAAMPKLLEDLHGVGPVLREGQLVREMNYSIQIYQRIRETGRGEVILGAMFIEGSVDYDLIRDSIDLIGAELMLHLQDGRTLPFLICGDSGQIAAAGELK
jgi:hypothetical protein